MAFTQRKPITSQATMIAIAVCVVSPLLSIAAAHLGLPVAALLLLYFGVFAFAALALVSITAGIKALADTALRRWQAAPRATPFATTSLTG